MRRRLPSSRDWMMTFWIIAYQMLCLFLETVGGFEEIWLECLGDLARYKMAIEDADPYERDHYAATAYQWYMRTADMQPDVGRLCHHQAVLCRRQPLRQLGLYSLSLTARQSFLSAQDSMHTLLKNAINWQIKPRTNSNSFQIWLVRFIAELYKDASMDQAITSKRESLDKMRDAIVREGEDFRQMGMYAAFSVIACLMDWGLPSNTLRKAFLSGEKVVEKDQANLTTPPRSALPTAAVFELWSTFCEMMDTAIHMTANPSVLPMLIVMVTFVYQSCKSGVSEVTSHVPWERLMNYMNTIDTEENYAVKGSRTLPKAGSMLQEDHSLRGKAFLPKDFFSVSHFERATDNVDERYHEKEGSDRTREQRLLWIFVQITKHVDIFKIDDCGKFCLKNAARDVMMYDV